VRGYIWDNNSENNNVSQYKNIKEVHMKEDTSAPNVLDGMTIGKDVSLEEVSRQLRRAKLDRMVTRQGRKSLVAEFHNLLTTASESAPAITTRVVGAVNTIRQTFQGHSSYINTEDGKTEVCVYDENGQGFCMTPSTIEIDPVERHMPRLESMHGMLVRFGKDDGLLDAMKRFIAKNEVKESEETPEIV
jgi:hypothetical protein